MKKLVLTHRFRIKKHSPFRTRNAKKQKFQGKPRPLGRGSCHTG
jgi:hypothetical protein